MTSVTKAIEHAEFVHYASNNSPLWLKPDCSEVSNVDCYDADCAIADVESASINDLGEKLELIISVVWQSDLLGKIYEDDQVPAWFRILESCARDTKTLNQKYTLSAGCGGAWRRDNAQSSASVKG
ncbi:MAG: hypothetical protein WCF85_19020 [Rhodospirillaceae bacterium]